MKKHLYTSVLALSSALLIFSACGDMKESYKAYLGDGPIVYLGKVDVDGMLIQPGRNRIKFTLPAPADPRAKSTKITWANGVGEKDIALNLDKPTEVIIEDIDEASYEFVFSNFNDDGLSSVRVYAVANVYGDVYESYLRTRRIESTERDVDNKTLTVHLIASTDDTEIATEVKWTQNGETRTEIFEKTADNSFVVEDFEGLSFEYRSCYLPEEDAIDTFYSKYVEYEYTPTNHDLDRAGWSVTTSYPEYLDNPGTANENGRADQLIDDSYDTFLSLAKPGKANIPADAECFFIIDMGEPTTFDHYTMHHRHHTSVTLRVQKISFYGSNDGVTFEPILEGIDLDYLDSYSYENQGDLPVSTYRYLKMTYDEWNTVTSNSMQLSDFKLGVKK